MQMYSQDYDEKFMGYGTFPDGSEQSWGKYYWIFQLKPYLTAYPANFTQSGGNIFLCPSDSAKTQYLSDDRATQVWPEPATSWGLTMTTDPDGAQALAYRCSYSINEHITDRESKGGPAMAAWQDPTRSYMIMEARTARLKATNSTSSCFNTPAAPTWRIWMATSSG
jgi:hypothetical protein